MLRGVFETLEGMNKRTLLIAALALVACEEATPEDLAEQVLSDAGRLLQDAGTALADAGQVLADAGGTFADSGTARAQVDASTPAVTRQTLDQACDQVRMLNGGPYGMSTVIQHFARFDAKLADVRSAWVCESPTVTPLDCPSNGAECSGARPPKMTCTTAGVMEGTDGSLWILCSGYARARIVLD